MRKTAQLNEILFFLFACGMFRIKNTQSKIYGSAAEQQDKWSNKLSIGKNLHTPKSNERTSNTFNSTQYKKNIDTVYQDYCKIILMIATSYHVAIKLNLAEKTGKSVDRSLKSIIHRLVAFCFAMQFSNNFNRTLTNDCYKKNHKPNKVAVISTVTLSKNSGIMVIK